MNHKGRILIAWAGMFAVSGCYSGINSFGDDPNGLGDGLSGAEGSEDEGEGETDGSDDPNSDDPNDPNDPGGVGSCNDVGARMLRRLTSRQLRRTLQSIFADDAVPDGQVLTDPVVHGFKVDAREAVIRDLAAQQVMQYAETVAAWAVDQKLAQITPCQSMDAGCQEQIVRELGAKFHREPLDDTMVTAYQGLMAGQETFDEGMRQLLSALIQSPYFLYRRELGEPSGDDPDRFQLTDYELASNLSYSLTGSPPDQTLLELAAQGSLRDEDELVAQVARLVQSSDGQHSLQDFVESWLEIEDLPSRVKVDTPGVNFDEDVRHDMLTETSMLFRHVFNTGGSTKELLLADFTFINQRLGQFYKIWEADTEDHQSIEIPASGEGARAPGLLGHGSVLARHSLVDNSSPVARGVMVQRRLLCNDLPEPPSDVDTNLEPIPEGATNRERYEQHSTDPNCSGCHGLIDPIGFTFEHYDHFGLWRDEESGQPIDASGSLVGVEELVELDGLDSLAEALAEEAKVQECFAHYMSYYTYGVDSCSGESLVATAGGDQATLMSTLEAIVRSQHFRERVMGE